MKAQGRLLARYLRDLPEGKLQWIGVRPGRREGMVALSSTTAVAGYGLEGDRRMAGRPGSGRQVSLISVEFVDSIARHLGLRELDPALLRRNLLVSGINLNALRHQYFQIGDAVFQATALCHPCTRMDEALGAGGVVAMLGYGGLCARVLQSGRLAVGDRLRPLDEQALPESVQGSLF
ncbi:MULTISPECIES: MOSC domain-containing protein [Spongiibacter]|uniref:MOSC domain-containing protein n=1 Tax=Spongiibacter TaxID=630749 RepID=UPI000C3D65CB|nr:MULTISPECIES: MOSC domain-containing protein [Spongiibacter]MAY37402.1 sulfurase [Spongiibacter sp.]MBI57651.1 sulfurase [Spongiibacter sp.]|tara:strand:- start:764 stop:1297 length:534 start_codon:yes stop_codon:yes gene_type:complete